MCIISIMHLEGFRKDDYIQNVVPIHSSNTVKFDSSIKERKKERMIWRWHIHNVAFGLLDSWSNWNFLEHFNAVFRPRQITNRCMLSFNQKSAA